MSFKDFVVWVLIGLALFLVGCKAINHYWISTGIAVALAVVIGGLLSVRVVRWYICWAMARVNFIFTEVPEGRFKVVTRFGSHRKTILSKKGYKLSDDGDIVALAIGEQATRALPGGLHFVGWPGIDRIYSAKMKFMKSLPNGGVESHDKETEDTFYAKVDYPYALPFVDCEDINNLPLIGHATLLANVTGAAKSLFQTANFYETMIGLVLPSVRECLKGYGYDELKDKDDLDEIIWEALNEANPDAPEGVVKQLLDNYGLQIIALRIVNIDPADAELRELTLTRYKAERQADAAQAVARKEAEETEGRVVEAVARANGLTRKELEEKLKSDPKLKGKSADEGGFKEDFAHARDLLKRDRAGDGLEDIRIGNVDGTPLEPITGVIGALFGLKQRQGSRNKRNSKEGNVADKKGDKKKPNKRVKDMTEDELDELEKELDEEE
jgi:regulator of protease activity HflC (stomatin/prohibitin superfamily)